MPTVSLSPLFNGVQNFSAGGIPLSGGLLYTYLAGTTTPSPTYTDSTGATPNANPIVLDASGRPSSEIWILSSAYKFVLMDSLSNVIATYDNITSSYAYRPSGTGAVPTTVQAKLSESVSVKDFGAVGDGVTDDSAALARALTSLAANQTLEFPCGVYSIASATVMPVITAAACTIRGEDAVIQITGTTANVLFMFQNCGGKVEGIRFNGIVPTSGLGMGDVTYQGYQPILFNMTGALAGNLAGFTVTKCLFYNFGCQYWVRISNQSSYEVTDVNISGNTFISATGNAVAPASISAAAGFIGLVGLTSGTSGVIRRVIIANNNMDSSYIRTGIYIYSSISNVTINGNVIDYTSTVSPISADCGAYAILLYRLAGGGASPTGVTITGNIIRSPKSAGIYCQTATNVAIAGNVISGVTDVTDATIPKGGVAVNGSSHVSITGNKIEDCTRGIMLVGGSSYVDILANKITTSVNSALCVKMVGQNSNINLNSNSLDATGTTTTSIFIQGTSALNISNIDIANNKIYGTFATVYYYTADATQPVDIAIRNNKITSVTQSLILGSITGKLVVHGNVFSGNPANPYIEASSSTSVGITDNMFQDSNSAYSMRLSNTQGVLWGNTFVRSTALVASTTGEDLGLDTPTWAGVNGTLIQAVGGGILGTAGSFYRRIGWSHDGTRWVSMNTMTTINGFANVTFTMAAASAKVVSDANVTATSVIQLIPTNAAAATLMGGASSLYVSARSAGTSFTVATANGVAAAGNETFSYTISGI